MAPEYHGQDSVNPQEEAGPIVLLAYDGVAADEAAALVDILSSAELEVLIASVESDPVTSYHGRVVATKTAAEIGACSALVVPGGMGVRTAAENPALLGAIAGLAGGATWLGSTSTGSILLAAAGVVDGARATTHWLASEMITDRGLVLVDQAFVEHGRLLTAAGIVGTATLGFRLIGALAGAKVEERVREHFIPPRSGSDPRYARDRVPFWRSLGFGRRRRITDEAPLLSAMDPEGRAEVIVLDLVEPLD